MNERINIYTCMECAKDIITVDRDKGVTPFMLACRATVGCTGKMQSHFYRVKEGLKPSFEWYKPDNLKGLDKWTMEYVEKGGLLLREIMETPDGR